jgi:hypothetical protein
MTEEDRYVDDVRHTEPDKSFEDNNYPITDENEPVSPHTPEWERSVREKRTQTEPTPHVWNDTYCSCGQDVVTCQLCGKPVCAELTVRRTIRGNEGNVCHVCDRRIGILVTTGFSDMVKERMNGNCPFCHKKIDPATEFRNPLSKKEYGISGLCQTCQDKTFGAD